MKRCLTLLLAALCCAPFVALLLMGSEGWGFSPAVSRYIAVYTHNSMVIALASGFGALVIGSACAWMVVRYTFPFRRTLEWALLLPLAMPSYLLAMVYAHQLDVAGPVQSGLRELMGWQVGEYVFPNIRTLGGTVMMLVLSLYPYVYLAARQAFAGQSSRVFEAAWLAGMPPKRWLCCLALPMARPALALGVALVMMESLADFGVASLFGVPTFTTGIYRAWYGLGAPDEAARLALLMLALVALLVGLERLCRRRVPATKSALNHAAAMRLTISRKRGVFYAWLCALPVALGFVLPLIQLLFWALHVPQHWLDPLHWQAAGYGVLVAILAAFLALFLAAVFAYGLRDRPARWQTGLLRAAGLGYAVPGSVIAVALFVPLISIDKSIADLWHTYAGVRPGLLLTGSIAAMVLACSIRFLAVAMAGVEAGLNQVSPRMDEAARLLGASEQRIKRELHLPPLRLALLVGGFMVFADTLKELPASLLLRPFNVSTLSIRSYELASDGQLLQAAVPAVMMVLIGVLAVAVLSRTHRLPSHVSSG